METRAGTVFYSQHFKGKVITQSTELNLRATAENNGRRVGSLEHGKTYTFAGTYHTKSGMTNYAQAWLCCDADNDGRVDDGFASAQYIGWDSSLGSGNLFNAFVKIDSDYLNLRKTPSTSATIIGKLNFDEEVLWLNYEYVRDNGGWNASKWAHVATPVGTGWVLSKYLDRHG